ncbi:MAG TPA: sigma-70 family RNA polymerase sigma factor [Solirubrobacteraceae bacterium]|jgi:RNA polymerase sigma factor (sigma-70 family)|nr:sigma-70 family RNA polymerase sigma factor [Solirubrobacteraceae bacterium]
MHGRSPLLRLQSDERLIALVRRGNLHAFEALVARYQSRLLAFCRHMLSSKEDAEDVLQEVFAAAFNAILADQREINVRPWLYRIARNRSLNHLRRAQAVGVDSMDVHFSEHGLTTADKVHRREEFRLLVADVQELPETQKTALLLREIDALSYEQIAEAMETTVPSVKSLLVRARVALAEAAEARLLTCEEVREELGRVAEGLSRTTPPLRRHLRTCEPCSAFRKHLRATNRALAALFPVGPLFLLKKTLLAHLGTSAAASSGTAAAASGGAAAAAGAAAQAGIGTLATKTVAGLAAAAIVTAGAVEVQHVTRKPRAKAEVAVAAAATPAAAAPATPSTLAPDPAPVTTPARVERKRPATAPKRRTAVKAKVTDDAATADKPAAKAPAAEEPAVLTEEHESATTTLPSTTGVAAPSEGAIAPGDPSGPYAPPPPTATTQPSPTPTPAPTPTPTPTPEPTPVPTPTPTPEPTPDPSPTPPEQR